MKHSMKLNYLDPEWDQAEEANEKKMYYKCWMHNGGTCIKRYKPSVAKIVKARSMFKDMEMIPIKRPEAKKRKKKKFEYTTKFKSYYQPYSSFEKSMNGLY